MKIQSYYNKNGTDLIEKYIDSLTINEQVDGYDVLKQLEDDHIDTLTIKKWAGKIHEVYFYKHNRIFYVVADEDNIYLSDGNKMTKRTNKSRKKVNTNIIKGYYLSKFFERSVPYAI